MKICPALASLKTQVVLLFTSFRLYQIPGHMNCLCLNVLLYDASPHCFSDRPYEWVGSKQVQNPMNRMFFFAFLEWF